MIKHQPKASFAAIVGALLLTSVSLSNPLPRYGDCDCTKWPFRPDPPCFSECSAKVIRAASPEKLVNVLGVTQRLADKLVEFRSRHSLRSLDDLKTSFSQSEIDTIVRQIKTLDQRKVSELQNLSPRL